MHLSIRRLNIQLIERKIRPTQLIKLLGLRDMKEYKRFLREVALKEGRMKYIGLLATAIGCEIIDLIDYDEPDAFPVEFGFRRRVIDKLKLYNLMNAKKFNLEKLAKQVGLSKQAISYNAVRERENPDLVMRICKTLDCQPEDITREAIDNPIALFINEFCLVGYKDWIPIQQFNKMFTSWMIKNHQNYYKPDVVNYAMLQMGFDRKLIKTSKGVVWVWQDISWRTPVDMEETLGVTFDEEISKTDEHENDTEIPDKYETGWSKPEEHFASDRELLRKHS